MRLRARDGEQEQQGARVVTNPQLSLHDGFSSGSLWERSSSLGVVRCELDCTLNEHTHNEYGWVRMREMSARNRRVKAYGTGEGPRQQRQPGQGTSKRRSEQDKKQAREEEEGAMVRGEGARESSA